MPPGLRFRTVIEPYDWKEFSRKGILSQASDARLNIWEGAIRSSKTVNSIIAYINFLGHAPKGNQALVGKTERTLKRNIIDPMIEMFPGLVYHNVGAGEVWIGGTKQLYAFGANDASSFQKIRGLTLAGAYGDEITLWPQNMFQTLIGRLSVDNARFYGTTNPDTPMHYLKRDYLDRAHLLDMQPWHFTIYDNPALSQHYIDSLKQEYTGLYYRRYIDGLWVAAEGAIYDMFDPSYHVVKSIPEITRFFVGVDYGTTNPTVFLLAGIGVDDCLYVIDEWRWDSVRQQQQMTDASYSRALQNWLSKWGVAPRWIWIDPSAESFIVQLFEDRVPRITDADNAVLDGIRYTGSLFGKGRLFIHARCETLINELTGYSWDAKAQAKGEDAPLKVADHGPDALRYIINGTRQFWRRWRSRDQLAA